MSLLPLRKVSESEIEQFKNDGVVCLKQILPISLIQLMEAAVHDAIAREEGVNMNRFAEAFGIIKRDEPTKGRFLAGTDHWRNDQRFLDFATKSALPTIVAQLLQSTQLWLYEDSILIKEPGANIPTEWHTDEGYFHVTGEQIATTWVPLDQVKVETGAMRYVKGSHQWPQHFRPNMFVAPISLPETEGEEVPPIDLSSPDIITFDVNPGDLIVHHYRTLHGAPGNRSTTTSRRAISVRYCGDDARCYERAGAPKKMHFGHQENGDSLARSKCPQATLIL